MQVGDVVVPSIASRRNGRSFHCGSGYYSHAIVGCLDPFVLVSSSGDMVWSKTWHKEEVTALCQASAEVIQIVKARLENTQEHRITYGKTRLCDADQVGVIIDDPSMLNFELPRNGE